MASDSTLAAWIQAHDVSWKLSPVGEMRYQGKVVVGTLLTLRACHEGAHVEPNCEVCILLYARLRTIVEAVLSDDADEVACDFPPFGQTSRGDSGDASEVIFTVAIAQEDGSPQPVRRGIEHVVRRIRSRFQALGARASDACKGFPPWKSGTT